LNILFISYDGLTDPLGQSQIIPYFIGLSEKGYNISILSCEKMEKYLKYNFQAKKKLDKANITWKPVFYHKFPPVLSTLYDIHLLKKKASRLHNQQNFQVVHCRSYITPLVGLYLKKKYNLKFIFDIRGFWVDERVEGGIWNIKNPLFRLIYNYYKKKELEFFTQADHTISLTEKGKKIIQSNNDIPNNPIPVEVIPCCADLNHFSIARIDASKAEQFKSELGITEEDFVISYLGSIGTWYMLDEMLKFFKRLLIKKPTSKFLFISNDSPKVILNKAKEFEISEETIKIQNAAYQDIPAILSLINISIFFIKPVFSKNASSPTKQAEILGMGIPIICNANIGDTGAILAETNTGIVINDFTEQDYNQAINKIDEMCAMPKEHFRNAAIKHLSLEAGIEKYDKVYQSLQ